MRNLKRVLSLALALVMVLGMMVITTSAADFTDADEITNVEAVEVLAALGIVEGSNGAFNPNGTFTREAAAKLLTYMKIGPTMAEKLAGTSVFTDVAASRWSAKYIGYCANLGYITGVGNDKFNPSGVLTDIELGKLVLCAIGKDPAKYTGTNWASAVTVDMIDAGLVDSVSGAPISREDACAMILAGMKYSETPDTYNVIDTANNDKVVANFEDLLDAVLYTTVLNDGGTRYDYAQAPATDTLLAKVYGVTYKADDADEFGRPAVSYTNAKTKLDLVYAEEADYTITLAKNYTADEDGLTALVADVIKATGVKKMNATTAIDTGKVVVDGLASANKAAVLTAMAAAAKAGTTMELYMAEDGLTVEDIIVTVTYADTVKKVTKADAEKDIDASIELTGGLTYKTDAYAKDDVVIYTKAWNATEGKYEIQTIAKAESVTGKLTSYNSKGEYTIGGETYKVSSMPVAGFSAINVAAQINKEYVYFLGADGKIVYGTSVKGEAPAVITDYALITDTALVAVEDAFKEVSSYTAHVKATLSDGTNGTFELIIEKATKGDNKGKFVYNIGKTEVVVGTDLTALENNLFTYTVDDGVITLASKVAVFTGSETKSGAAWHYVKTEAGKTSTTIETHGGTVIANESTVFVLKKNNGYEIKTGIASLEDTKIPAGSLIIVDVTYSEKGNTNVAAVVYATGTSFAESGATPVADNYVYVDGTYVTTVNEKEETIYTYTVVKADGTTVEMTGAADLAEGIYEFNSKNELTTAKATTEVEVGTIAGTTYQLGADYKTVNDTAKVVVVAEGAALEKGAKVFYLQKDNVVSLIFVTEAAED